MLSVRLLGGLEIDGQPATHTKPHALLALLLAQPDRQMAREQVAGLLWPDSSDKSARQSLRTVLHQLRARLPAGPDGELVVAQRLSLGINPRFPVDVDLHRFRQAWEGRPQGKEREREALEEGIEAYRGPFLAGFDLGGDSPFAEWAAERRAWLQGQARQLFSQLARRYEEDGAFDAALRVLTAYVRREPEDDAGRHRLNELMARSPAKGEGGGLPGGQLERRRITAVYCELPLPDGEPREDRLAEIAAARQACRTELERWGGRVEPTPDGGMVGYFGQPPATERHVQDACDAALAVTRGGAPGMEGIRAGIHSDWTLTGEGGHPDYPGHVVRGAMRTARSAPEGAVFVTPALCGLLPPSFRCGPPSREAGEGGCLLRKTLQSRTGFRAPLVGRRQELAALLRAGRAVERGESRVVTVVGAPGVGKSRLVTEARSRLEDRLGLLTLSCREVEQGVALAPFRDLLEGVCRIGPGGGPGARAQRLKACLERQPGLDPVHHEALMGLLAGEDNGAEERTGGAIKAAVEAWLRSLVRGPTLLLVEDMHWADAVTREVLQRLAADSEGTPLGIWLTTRPEGAAHQPTGRQIRLAPLPGDRVRELVGRLAPARTLSREDRERIVAAAEGIPLFAEELVWTEERAEGKAAGGLTEALVARFDQAGSARRAAQLGALVGRGFDADLLARLEGQAPEDVRADLEELERRDLIRFRGTVHGPRYDFRHALLEEAAYQSLPPLERFTLHARLAELLPRLYPGEVEARPDWLAWHHERAGAPFPAARFQFRAAGRSAQLGAHQQALDHLEKARDLLTDVPDSAEKRDLIQRVERFETVQSLFPRGPGSLGGEEAGGGDPPEEGDFEALFAELLRGMADQRWADLKARAEALLARARVDGDAGEIASARHLLAFFANYAGDLALAEAHFADVLPAEVQAAPERLVRLYNGPPKVVELAYRGLTALRRGHTSEAEWAEAEARRQARRYGAPNLLAYVLTLSAGFRRYCGEPGVVLAHAREVAEISREEGLWATRVVSLGYRQWAKAALGRPAGLDRVRAVARSEGGLTGGFMLGPLLAPAYGYQGRLSEQIDLIRWLLRGEGGVYSPELYHAELYHLLGEALLRVGEAPEGEYWLERAVRTARATGHRRQRLRAALSLAGRLQETGRGETAEQLLNGALAELPAGEWDPDRDRARRLLQGRGQRQETLG